MPADFGLHGLRARHRRLPAQQRSRPAEERGRGSPDGRKRRGPDAVLGEQGVEFGEVARFLRVHMLHEGEEGGMCAREGRGLRGIDERGS